MCIELSRLEKVELREVWDTEDQHFTPWLAEEENLALLGETLGLELELEGQEIPVGDFRADILCMNRDGSRVLIENQLEYTDHSHLGQILTYSAGLGVQTVIWIAKNFRDEHRAALDSLNDLTADKGFRFFGVEIKLWKIGNSARAPQFEVVSSPNDWSNTAIQNAQSAIHRDLTETQRQQEEFWTKLRDYMTITENNIPFPKPTPTHYLNFRIGRSNFGIRAWHRRRNKDIGVSIFITGQNAKVFFNLLRDQQQEIENEFGESLEWSEAPEVEESQVYLVKENIDPTDETDWNNQHEWLASQLERFDKIFRRRIIELNVTDRVKSEDDEDM